MKKAIIALPLLSSLCLLAACNNSAEPTPDAPVPVADSPAATTDTSATVDISPVLDEPSVFEYFEDYSVFNTKALLEAEFGKENLQTETRYYAEGTVQMETSTLHDPNNGYILYFAWDEERGDSLSHIEAHYRITDPKTDSTFTQKVKTRNGLYTGMTVPELVEWNGGHFNFSGFGWDYEGGIYAEEGSKFAKSDVGINLTLDWQEGQDHTALSGDVTIRSDNPALEGAPVYLRQLTWFRR